MNGHLSSQSKDNAVFDDWAVRYYVERCRCHKTTKQQLGNPLPQLRERRDQQ